MSIGPLPLTCPSCTIPSVVILGLDPRNPCLSANAIGYVVPGNSWDPRVKPEDDEGRGRTSAPYALPLPGILRSSVNQAIAAETNESVAVT